MKSYRQQKRRKTSIRINESIEGETLEQKIDRILNNKEPITDGAPIIYQERQEGVNAAYNIRTDRFEIAVDAMDKVTGSHKAKREARIVKLNEEKEGKKDGKTESTQGQGGDQNNGSQTTE